MKEEKEIQREPPQNEQADKQRPYIKVYDDFREYLGLKGNELDAFSIIYSFATQTKEKAYTGSSLHLAKRMKVKKDTARDILNRLSSKGYLIKKEGTNGSRNIYFLNQEIISNLDPYEKQNTPTPKDKLPRISDYPEKRGTPAPNSGVLTTPKNGVHLPRIAGYSNINSNINSNITNNTPEKVVSESEKEQTKDNLLATDIMNEEVKQILTLYQELNPRFTPNDIDRLIALIEEYPSDSIKKVLQEAQSRNITSIKWIENTLRNPITAKRNKEVDTDEIDRRFKSDSVLETAFTEIYELYPSSWLDWYTDANIFIWLYDETEPEERNKLISDIKDGINGYIKQKWIDTQPSHIPGLNKFLKLKQWENITKRQKHKKEKNIWHGLKAPSLEEAAKALRKEITQ